MPVGAAISLVSPLSALVALLVAAPLVAFAAAGRRAAHAAEVLRLPEEARRRRRAAAVAIAVAAALLGLAAAQPVLAFTGSVRVRNDVQAFVVFDTSRSMLASLGFQRPNRLERAKAFAIRLRARFPEIPFGIASMTDRTLPHLFPSTDTAEFAATARRAIGIERPPPDEEFSLRATTLDALAAFGQGFFGPVPHRIVVVLTDGESRPFVDARIGRLFRRPPGIHAVFVRFWNPRERIYVAPHELDTVYGPDVRSGATIASLAAVTGGTALDETQLDAAAAAVRRAAGAGPTVRERPEERRLALAPYFALAALAPLGLLLYRRNL